MPASPSLPLDPAAALREVAFWMDRARADSRRVLAYRKAAAIYEALPAAERESLRRTGRWTDVAGIGPKTAAVIAAAVAGEDPPALARLRTEEPLAPSALRDLVRGDLHSHTEDSDGSAPLAEMAATAAALGREYLAVTDHSPRLTVAHGLSAERLAVQGGRIDALNRELGDTGIRVLKGIEVDILDDGALDQADAALDGLDVVVASVHSKLRADSETMTHRMVAAVANPRTNVLGHCTGRLVEGVRGTRPPSGFDAEVVFEACRAFDVAVEINSRPERQDPPDDLIALALETGCLFAIDTDAHAPGQLPFTDYGCARAEAAGIPAERIVTTWPVEDLLAWTRAKR